MEKNRNFDLDLCIIGIMGFVFLAGGTILLFNPSITTTSGTTQVYVLFCFTTMVGVFCILFSLSKRARVQFFELIDEMITSLTR